MKTYSMFYESGGLIAKDKTLTQLMDLIPGGSRFVEGTSFDKEGNPKTVKAVYKFPDVRTVEIVEV